jgi:ribonucleoside-diphosphate reductase alpha chain
MSHAEFAPAGRTLANAGGINRVVSNCIVLHIEDTMESIFQTLHDAALLQKAGSGLGFPLHLMRPAGSLTKASLGSSSGPCSFLHVYNTAFGVVKQQSRNGANMAVMSVKHPDILEFIHIKQKEGTLSNFNVSVGLTDEFMSQVAENSQDVWKCSFDGQEYLPRRIKRDNNFNILEVEEVRMTATEIFEEIVDCAWHTGEPGCVFLDTVNSVNPIPGLGRLEACNPCGTSGVISRHVILVPFPPSLTGPSFLLSFFALH